MYTPEDWRTVGAQRQADMLADAHQQWLVARCCQVPTLWQRIVHQFGRGCLWTGQRLVCYGRVEQKPLYLHTYASTDQSSKLN